jgi:hypothetical protein
MEGNGSLMQGNGSGSGFRGNGVRGCRSLQSEAFTGGGGFSDPIRGMAAVGGGGGFHGCHGYAPRGRGFSGPSR